MQGTPQSGGSADELDALMEGLRADREALLRQSEDLAAQTSDTPASWQDMFPDEVARQAPEASGNGATAAGGESAPFDAVVDDAGEIKGQFAGGEPAASADEVLPQLFAPEAAQPEQPEKKAAGGAGLFGALSAKLKRNKKETQTEKNDAETGNADGGAPGSADGKGTRITASTNGKKRRKGKRTTGQIILRILIICVCIGIIVGSALGVAAALYLVDVTADDNKLLDIDQIKLSFASVLMAYDKTTESWYEYERIYSGENRIWVEYADMPECLTKVIIASEDQRFRSHHGVDWKRTIAAFINEYTPLKIFSGTQGGSTLTQQLVKNITNEKSVGGLDGALRKLREIYRALEMEKNYSKEQILEAYLNTFRLSGQVAGIEAAANYYFGKSTSELTMAECAAIVVITKAPTAYNPYENPDKNKQQRGYVLYNMLDYGLITQAEYDAAKAESDAMVFDDANKNTASTSTVYSYFTDAVISEILDDLVNLKGLTSSEANQLLFQGGVTVYLTVDPDIQKKVEEVAADPELWPALEYAEDGVTPLENQIQGAMVVMNYEGEVLGVAGGIRDKTTSLSLNRAVDSKRQTGSSMKPLAVYAPGIELNKITFSSLFPDSASELVNGEPWPVNFSKTYGTPVTVYKGLALSLNTIAIHVMKLVGYEFSYDFLTSSLGFTSLVDARWSDALGKYMTDRTLSLGLGALTDGATVLEMTSAYAIFGDGGRYTTPHFYTQICNSSGDVVFDKTKYVTKSSAISEESAEIMNHLLRGVMTEGTGTRARYGKMPLAGKSGTTSDNNDFWFIGLNPYYVMGVWMGYDQNGTMSPYSIHFDTQIAFKQVMSAISEELPYKDFPTTGNLVVAQFCLSSGDLATDACPNTRTGYYKKGYVPGYCEHGLYTNDGEGE